MPVDPKPTQSRSRRGASQAVLQALPASCLAPVSRSGPDQQIGDVVEAAERAIAVEQRVDLAGELAGRRAVRAHRAADQVKGDRLGIEIDRIAEVPSPKTFADQSPMFASSTSPASRFE